MCTLAGKLYQNRNIEIRKAMAPQEEKNASDCLFSSTNVITRHWDPEALAATFQNGDPSRACYEDIQTTTNCLENKSGKSGS